MKSLLNKLIASFENSKQGFSGRKLSAFTGILTALFISVKQVPSDFKLECVYAWLAFALLCLGIVTVQNILEFKNGKSENNNNSSADSASSNDVTNV